MHWTPLMVIIHCLPLVGSTCIQIISLFDKTLGARNQTSNQTIGFFVFHYINWPSYHLLSSSSFFDKLWSDSTICLASLLSWWNIRNKFYLFNAGDICYFMAKLFNQIEIRTNSTTTSMQMLFAAFFICIQIQFKWVPFERGENLNYYQNRTWKKGPWESHAKKTRCHPKSQ